MTIIGPGPLSSRLISEWVPSPLEPVCSQDYPSLHFFFLALSPLAWQSNVLSSQLELFASTLPQPLGLPLSLPSPGTRFPVGTTWETLVRFLGQSSAACPPRLHLKCDACAMGKRQWCGPPGNCGMEAKGDETEWEMCTCCWDSGKSRFKDR